MRRFYLDRMVDETGISGTGRVAEGVQFANGCVALFWLTKVGSFGLYASMEDVQAIHGHAGKTRIAWID